jgi:5'/3'-nucleotidase
MRVLLMNDDGVHAPGLRVLAERLHLDGHEIDIVAPLDGHSGSGTSIGGEVNGGFTSCVRVNILEGVSLSAFAVDGPPALAALAACHGLLDARPDLVISGINPGNNVGRLALHSGTLAAAMTVASYGWPAVAVSCAGTLSTYFAATADFVASKIDDIAEAAMKDLVLNINYPPCSERDVRGVREASMAAPISGDLRLVQDAAGFRLSLLRPLEEVAEDSDLALLHAGYITITYLRVGYGPPLNPLDEG